MSDLIARTRVWFEKCACGSPVPHGRLFFGDGKSTPAFGSLDVGRAYLGFIKREIPDLTPEEELAARGQMESAGLAAKERSLAAQIMVVNSAIPAEERPEDVLYALGQAIGEITHAHSPDSDKTVVN